MGNYIGRNLQFGLLEKQVISVVQSSNPSDIAREYDLNYPISTATSIQVVCERAILEPVRDYTIIQTTDPDKGLVSKIRFDDGIDLTNTGADGVLSVYVIFLGERLIVPTSTSGIGDTIQSQLDSLNQNKLDTASFNSGISTTLASAQAYTDTKITDLVNGAPGVLDTLKELSDAVQELNAKVEALEAQIAQLQSQ